MVNNKGGKKQRKSKNSGDACKRELLFKVDGQEYAQVLKMLGDRRLEVDCLDGVKRLAVIRGNMRKRTWICVGDLILIGLRDFQDGRADVIHKYSVEEGRSLKAYGELPDTTILKEKDPEINDNADIDFTDAMVNDI